MDKAFPDKLDLQILEILETDGRISNKDLAEKIGLSPAPTLERVKKLEEAGYVTSYHAKINKEKFGLTQLTLIEVTLKSNNLQGIDKLVVSLKDLNVVIDCYKAVGRPVFYIKTLTSNLTDVERLIYNSLDNDLFEKTQVIPLITIK